MKTAILKDILIQAQECQSRDQKLSVFFDLDSTLFDVSPRISKILHHFAELPEIASKYPVQAAQLLTVEPAPGDWGVKRTLDRYGFTPRPDDEFIKKLVTYWKTQFFSSDYLRFDRPYAGAQEFLSQLAKAGAAVSYLSGRDVPRMREGSIEVLKYHGFPLNDDISNLFLKPSTGILDHEFKVKVLKLQCENNKTMWFFENEPAIIHPVLESCPHVSIVFVDTVHSDSAPPPPDSVHRISTYL